jgi:hypothetical protein
MVTLTLLASMALAAPGDDAPRTPAAALDTVRLEVGSPEIDGRVFPSHRARNRSYPAGGGPPVSTWTNELTVGDSAGTPVHRWVTRGVQMGPEGEGATWELVQTYDARTLAPLTYHRWSGDGSWTRLRLDGTRVRGMQQIAGEAEPRAIEQTLDRPAFFEGASDLVPMAMRLDAGDVVIVPVWAWGMPRTESRVFTALGRERVSVEGLDVSAWKVEERVEGSGRRVAIWYVTDSSPYMVLAEIPTPDGSMRRLTGVALDPPGS